MAGGFSQTGNERDAGLWLAAVGLSLGINGVFLVILGWQALRELELKPDRKPPQAATEYLLIEPIFAEPTPEEPAVPAKPESRPFVRTNPEDQAEPVEDAPFMGENDTRAASEKPAVEDGPENLPNQDGVEPVFDELETTESDYQDGDLDSSAVADPTAVPETTPSPPMPETAAAESEATGNEGEGSAAKGEAEGEGDEQQPKPPSPPTVTQQPGFRGNQKRTQLRGSISRSGRPALDVDAGPLGKYHAEISRAIEQAWQRQVVKNRDFITPGVIRVRVVLDPQGEVRTVATVEEFGIGTIQKGFTHAAIREADLPAMPPEVKRDLQGEPLELLYNFIF
ncbi:MAG: hypothetical protein MUF31_19010 [Akkermansiaceae bacterium]|nr:hypothetical protein [Akkermansiaceae bacterium]